MKKKLSILMIILLIIGIVLMQIFTSGCATCIKKCIAIPGVDDMGICSGLSVESCSTDGSGSCCISLDTISCIV